MIEHDISGRRPLGLPIAWWVALGTAIGLSVGFSAVASTVFGQFVTPLSQAFGWSRGETTLAVAFANIPLLLMAPLFGVLIDRMGAWRTLCVSQVAVPLILMSLATLQGSLTQLYISFFLLALFGAGTLPAAYTRIILTWFDRRRGLGFGIALSGVGLASLVLPPISQALIGAFGWRMAIVSIGVLFLLVGGLNVATLLRIRPQGPHEIDAGAASGSHPAIDPLSGIPWRKALRTMTYWTIALAFVPLGAASMGLLVNLPSILADRGFSPLAAASGVSILGATLIFARLVTGWLLDNVSTMYVVAVIFAAPALGFFLLADSHTAGITAFAIFLIAFGIGAEFDVMAFLLSRLFGPISYGGLYGGVYAAYNIGVAVGPAYLATRFDASGTYDLALAVFAVLFLLSGAVLTIVARRVPGAAGAA
ncbi:MFS transporter [Sphingomonas canadensis]|uniref:MFS transporter n=1 Tax=Sphingomonas canadensis TaxID=1219257 RepID=A0ABW3H5E4_9SPHN|nr:MFS transporter [Sphingomonas canadensis]MCW3834520.1 MFS transporter [Sphingomonas canadensis]